MKYDTSELCDIYQEDVTSWNRCSPTLADGRRLADKNHGKMFRGQRVAVRSARTECRGRVLVVDGGGSVRRALVDVNWRVWQYKMNGKVWSFTARASGR